MVEVTREEVWLDPWGGTMTNVDLRRGHYEIWIEDRTPGERDYDHFIFGIEDGSDTVDITPSDGSVSKEIDGDAHELYCTFEIRRSDMYFYFTEMDSCSTEADQFDMIFMRSDTWTDQPTFWVGLTFVALGSITIPVLFVTTRSSAKGNKPGQHPFS
jgi:hypothetical protein